MLTTVAITTVVWLVVTFLTPPESMETSDRILSACSSSWSGWAAVAAKAVRIGPRESLGVQFFNWILGLRADLHDAVRNWQADLQGMAARWVFITVAVIAAALISRNLSQTDWTESKRRSKPRRLLILFLQQF